MSACCNAGAATPRGFVKKGYRVAIDSPTNQQFVVLPNEVVDDLREKGVSFEDWGIRGEKETTVRFVTSWATTEEDVKKLVEPVEVVSSIQHIQLF